MKDIIHRCVVYKEFVFVISLALLLDHMIKNAIWREYSSTAI